ncbi:MAG TPA: aminotransferase class IV [Thermodesulfobacteriota bacterium]|nr:aminotransferase class IV [Thermodesulfobacteriota bacterium]
MKSEKVYINGRIVPSKLACVSVFDRGLNYADGVFETMKAKEGRVFLLKEHLKRLKRGAEILNIPSPPFGEMEKAIKKLLKINNLSGKKANIKIILTRGEDMGGHLPQKKPKPTVIITARRLDTESIRRMQKTGVKAVLLNSPPFSKASPSFLKRGQGRLGGLGGIKSLDYLSNVLGKIKAQKKGAYEGIFIENGKLLEGTSTNVFIVKDGVLKTPPLKSILQGITRKAVIDIAKKSHIPAKETPVSAGELKKAAEAFITNSIIGIVPLIRVDSFRIGSGKRGNITRLLQEYLRKKESYLKKSEKTGNPGSKSLKN